MKLLMLGGTRFLGRHVVTAALVRHHDITLSSLSVYADYRAVGLDETTPLMRSHLHHVRGIWAGQ